MSTAAELQAIGRYGVAGGLTPSSHKAFCRPSLRLSKLYRRKTDGAGLLKEIGQHEVIDHVVEGLAEDGDAELGHAGKVRLSEPTRLVDLGEEDLLGRTFEGAPPFDPALQATELDVRETSWKTPLQVEEEGLGLEPRVDPEQFKRGFNRTSWNGSSRVRQVCGTRR